MGGRIIGLDIGTHAVTAAELSLGRKPTLHRFGQVALPLGAMSAGDVVDPDAVTEAIKRLWREAGFKSRQVVLGLGNHRVVVRQAEMPDLSHEELRAAITFQARELIPIPIDEAQFDVKVLAELPGAVETGEAGEPAGTERRVRVMIAAAPRDMISGLLAAVEAAGLQPAAVNLVPLAMIKALGDTSWPEADEHRGGSMAEAIVAVGAGTTNVVIHEAGVPSFVRILDQGGNSLTRAIADELDLSWDDAEDLKRRADPMIYGPEEMAARVINSHLAPFIEEIRGSLDYYQVQNGRDGLRRVVLTGAGSRVAGLPERLSVLLGVPVVQGHVLQRLSLGKLRVGEDELAAAEDLLSVAVGLALDGQSGTGTEHALNLLPPEILRRRADRRQLTMAATAVGLLAVGLLGVWFLQHSEATSTASIATQTERSNTTLRARMAPAAGTTGATAGIAERNKLAAQVTKGEVSWSTVLAGVAGSMPTDVWLTSFQGTGATPKSPATVAVNAKGLSYGSASSWLGSMGDSPLISGLWVPNTSTSSENGSVLFTSTFQLTSRALSARQSLLADAAAGRTAKPPVTPVTSTPATTTSTTTSTTTTTTTVPAATTSTAPVAPAQETVDVFNRQQAALDAAGGSPP